MKDGGYAFPGQQQIEADGKWNQTFDPGMSLRDYLAGQAIIGVLRFLQEDSRNGVKWPSDEPAHRAYQIADSMLVEREKGAK